MTSKLTREQLIKKAQEQIEFCRHTNITGDGRAHVDQCAALFEIALAAMDSEPVAIVEPSDYVTAAQLVGEGPVRKAVHELYEGALRIGDKLYRHAQPAQTGVDDDVRNIIGLLETNEWAEHCTETVLGSRLEAEITRLVGSAQTAPVVPDKMTYQDGVLFVLNNDMSSIERGTVAMRAWNACRAAMLAPAPQEAQVVPEKIEQSRKRVDRCDVCTEGARGGCGTCIFNGNFE